MSKAPDVVTLALTFADGTVGIMSFVTREFQSDGTIRWQRVAEQATIEPTLRQLEQGLAAEKVPIMAWRPIDPNDIPKDRTFRNALKPDLTHDMQKARAIHRDRMRVARVPLLADLDVQVMRSMEAGAKTVDVEIATEKQTLRDVTADPAIDAAQTVDELKAVWPFKQPYHELV